MNTVKGTHLDGEAAVVFAKSAFPACGHGRPGPADLPADWLTAGPEPEALLALVAPTWRDLRYLQRAHQLVGALYGPARQREWLTTDLAGLGVTPLAYLTVRGPDGWPQLLFDLNAAMQGGSCASEADREWATARLAGHTLTIRQRTR